MPLSRIVFCRVALLAIGALPIAPCTRAVAQTATQVSTTADDHEAVRRAVLDYVDGFYEGDSTKLLRSVRPDVFKYGFWRPADSTRYGGESMPFAEFLTYAAHVKARNRPVSPAAPRDVEIFELQNMTASAKLTAYWGTDYLLLGKYDGCWMISSVLWQSPPQR